MPYEAIIGMEVHAQILTRSKMFCGCSADYAHHPPNTHTCPVCLGMPGVLPVINKAAVQATVLTGAALYCEIPPFSKFDRKNYPYPDLPKGYQISQYDLPFCVNGYLEVESQGQKKRIRIRRVHLEEDTAKLTHVDGGSLIDYNRSGVPLMEIVTEADIRTADEAWQYLLKLRSILRFLGVSTGNMEDAAMRCEANISLRPAGSEAFGTKVEVKNLNSFRSVRQAVAYEIERQTEVLDSGGTVLQVTMGWDEDHHRTVFQRSKEYAEDYRYFPEPDLPPIEWSREYLDEIRSHVPELPDAKRVRYMAELGIKPEDAALLSDDRDVAAYFEQSVVLGADMVDPQTIANWIVGEIFRLLNERDQVISDSLVTPADFVALLEMNAQGDINNTVAKDVLAEMFVCGEPAAAIIERRGLGQISDHSQLRALIEAALDDNPKPLQQYIEGKRSVMGFFIGQVMRATQGRANAQLVRELLLEALQRRAG